MKVYERIAEKMIEISDLKWSVPEEKQKCKEGLKVLMTLTTNFTFLMLIGIITGTWKWVLILTVVFIGIKWFTKTSKEKKRKFDCHD